MMKFLFLLCYSFFIQTAFCQLNYQKVYQEALNKAHEEKKLLFIEIGFSGGRSNSVKSGLYDPQVVDFYNKNFINFKTDITDTVVLKKLRKFPLSAILPCYLFVDDTDNFVYKFTGNTANAEPYLTMAKEALSRNYTGRTLSAYERRYNSGNVDAAFLKDYIILRQEFGLSNNAKLIERYVDFLTIGQFNDYQTVVFVLSAGPLAYGRAYNLAYTNRKIIDSLYKKGPLGLRVAINNRIITNTRAEAIAAKDRAMAQNVSNFTRSAWTNNYLRGNKEAINEMLIYYKAIKDTAQFFREAIYFYENNYMTVATDSIKKLVKEQELKLGKDFGGANDIIQTAKGPKVISKIVIDPQDNPVSIALNNGAWDFYMFGTKNTEYLLKALRWSMRSINLSPDNYAFYDTYAHLLYRLNLFNDAESNQALGIKIAQQHNVSKADIENLQSELKKMKERKI